MMCTGTSAFQRVFAAVLLIALVRLSENEGILDSFADVKED